MIVKSLIFLTTFIFIQNLRSQNFTTREHCFFSNMIYNPSVVGTNENTYVYFSSKKNWTSIDNSPYTCMLNVHTKASNLQFSNRPSPKKKLYSKIGIGLSIYRDINGPLSVTGIQTAYSYQIPLKNKSIFSMGLSAKIAQYALDENVFKPTDQYDTKISFTRQKGIIPNFNFGLYLKKENYYIGLSSTNLAKLSSKNITFYNQEIHRTLYLVGAYKFNFIKDSKIEPNVLFRYDYSNLWFDFTTKYYYKNLFTVGLGYSTSGFYSTFLSTTLKEFTMGYAFEYSTSPIYKLSNGNHQIFIGYHL